MSTYSDLQIGKNYLIREEEGDEITLVQPLMETSKCLYILQEDDDVEITFWKEKTEEVFEIVDELDEEQVIIYETLFDDEDDEDLYEDED